MDLIFLILVIFCIFIVLIILLAINAKPYHFESGQERAGKYGEFKASEYIKSVLKEGDTLLNNIEIEYDGKPCECDDIVINKYGVFIIEVKYYEGEIEGNIDDYEWTKIKVTDAGNVYEKTVSNPIKQVNRQVYILSNYLKDNGIFVWIEGYAMIIGNNTIKHEQMLNSKEDIDKAIHTASKKNPRGLSKKKQEEIVYILKTYSRQY